MDLYAFQMTPKKKEEKIEKKSPKEHLFTKEELDYVLQSIKSGELTITCDENDE